jgi:hypothetical protein
MRSRYGADGFTVVGIHTPEFDHERDPRAVAREIDRHGLSYPHLLDNDAGYWRALGNEYWPAFYLVDRCGRIRERLIGEAHVGEARADAMEAALKRLLAENDASCTT